MEIFLEASVHTVKAELARDLFHDNKCQIYKC